MHKSATTAVGALAAAVLVFLPAAGRALAEGPSFDCGKVAPGSIEELICKDGELSALDREMASVYAAAAKKAANEHPPSLRAEQRGWIKGRNDCWKSDDKKLCVRQSYRSRIAELQARYRLVPVAGTARYVCDGNAAKEVIATYFRTDPGTGIAEFGDRTALLFQQRSGSGIRYAGQNVALWEHQGTARITWGDGSPEMRCEVAK